MHIAELCSPRCFMLYCRTKVVISFDGLEADTRSATLALDGPDEISSFRCVDLLPSAKPRSSKGLWGFWGFWRYNQGGGSGGSVAEFVWYCNGCGEGPIPDWNPVCVSCDSKKN